MPSMAAHFYSVLVTVAVFCSTVLCLIEQNWWLASGTDETQQIEEEDSNIPLIPLIRLFVILVQAETIHLKSLAVVLYSTFRGLPASSEDKLK